jgi:hypothetical protein
MLTRRAGASGDVVELCAVRAIAVSDARRSGSWLGLFVESSM